MAQGAGHGAVVSGRRWPASPQAAGVVEVDPPELDPPELDELVPEPAEEEPADVVVEDVEELSDFFAGAASLLLPDSLGLPRESVR